MVWLATDKLLVEALVATPLLLRLTAAPKFVPSITNCTVPVGVLLPEAGVTVAVKLTPWPTTDGLADAARAVLLPGLLPIVCPPEREPELGAYVLSPE
jgi:hypothetical protein